MDKGTFGLLIFFEILGLVGCFRASVGSVGNARGPRERSFMAKAVTLFWFATIGIFTTPFVAPDQYAIKLFLVLCFVLLLGVAWVIWMRDRIRKMESASATAEEVRD